ncbi:MAG: diaminopimelate decarboxylase [Spirochaetota bacterium]|jgi:diaminopimelate decarboxylase|nr:diaminopimelate decarboxylase [Spirochaetota bacterium]
MTEKKIPLSREELERIAAIYPTPFYIYDERTIRRTIRRLNKAFSWAPLFREYYAVKANPNPHILMIARDEGCGADCSSLPELLLAGRSGLSGHEIMFSSNATPLVEFKKAAELNAFINFDDLSHLDFFHHGLGKIPELLCFRYNPGTLRTGNAIIGVPEEAKYGCTREQLFTGYRRGKELGAKRFGIHTMIASNERNPRYFVDTAIMLFELVRDLGLELGIRFEFVNMGGGIGIPYQPDQEEVNLELLAEGVREAYSEIIIPAGLDPLAIFMENARMITGPSGYLVSRVLHIKKTYKTFIGLDACMANLMRPALYGAYHHITIPGRENEEANFICDVTGSLCENNDKFAIDRKLPEPGRGDLLVIHDTGAHGHSMGFNYNGKLRSAELLLREDGSIVQIRRAETCDDLFATIMW